MATAGKSAVLGSILAALAIGWMGCADQNGESVAYNPSGPTAPLSRPAESPAGEMTKAGEAQADDPSKSATAGRKIIYNAHVDVVTEDLNRFETSLTKLIEAQKAYVADSERTGSAGATRHGTWKVRVPVDAYDAFVKGVVALGELVSLKADSQDVSEEYFDLDARTAAKKVEETRLLKHLTDSTGKLDEILTVERELSRVRSEIERMQGRLRGLANLSSLATVTINANEIKGYVPPQSPTLGTRLARTFFTSLETLQQFGEAVLIFLAALAPWLPLIALTVGIIVWTSRRAAR